MVNGKLKLYLVDCFFKATINENNSLKRISALLKMSTI